MPHNLFHRLSIASSALPEAPLLRASLLATMCVLYVSGFRKADLVAYSYLAARTCDVSHRGVAPM
eukprot:6208053-Pleurochrysis_carterae.AAC.1